MPPYITPSADLPDLCACGDVAYLPAEHDGAGGFSQYRHTVLAEKDLSGIVEEVKEGGGVNHVDVTDERVKRRAR